MAPLIRRTWGLRGLTPLLRVRARSHEKVSGIGALVVSPRRRRVSLCLALYHKENIRGPQILNFLRSLRENYPGPIMLLWDRGTPHRHHEVSRYLQLRAHWQVEWLPPYAPELNPVEQLWTYLKYGHLSNFAPDTVEEIKSTVRKEVRKLSRRPHLLRSFFHHSKLPFRV